MYSFTTMATPGYTAEEAIRLASRYGYDGIDLRISDYKGELNETSTKNEISHVRKVLDSEGIQSSGLFCYNKSGDESKESWIVMRESILRLIDIAEQLNSPSIRISAGYPGKFPDRDEYIKHNAEVLGSILKNHSSNIDLLIQNHTGGYLTEDAVKLINMVDSARIGLAFSPDHCVIEKEDMEKAYKTVRDVTKQIYIADIELKSQEYIPLLPGKGCVPIKDALMALGGKSFKGWITFKWEKIWHEELQGPEIALPYFIEYMKGM